MPTGTIILLGAFAGLTIYLGLPFAFLKRAPQSLKVFCNMLATGVLIFLLYDVISKASEPINDLVGQLHSGGHNAAPSFFLDISLLVLGLLLGLVGLVYFNKYMMARARSSQRIVLNDIPPVSVPQPVLAGVNGSKASETDASSKAAQSSQPAMTITAQAAPSPQMLALFIATGIGFHNFSEGLAIGQSAATGALQLAIVLIIGFGLHNMTEGFGIAGPLTGQTVPWKFIALLGLVGGGPTFLGTIVGIVFHSTALFIFCLALAAGAILYVVTELLGVAKRFKSPEVVVWGLLIGFLLGYLTDLIVTYGGA